MFLFRFILLKNESIFPANSIYVRKIFEGTCMYLCDEEEYVYEEYFYSQPVFYRIIPMRIHSCSESFHWTLQ